MSDDIDAGSREHYADGALYDYEYRRRRADVAFYRDLAKRHFESNPGRILDLGCGSGRIAIPLLRDGHTVTAIDASEPMLERLRARTSKTLASRLTASAGDLRAFEIPGKKHPLAIAAFNVIEHLYTRSEVHACLTCVAKALTPDGIFAFDVQNPDLRWLSRDPNKKWARTRFTDPSTGKAMIYSTNHQYDPVSQIALIRLYYEPADGKGPSRVVRLSQRKFFPAELEALVAHAGFRVIERYGDFSSGPLEGGSESQVLICAKKFFSRRKTA